MEFGLSLVKSSLVETVNLQRAVGNLSLHHLSVNGWRKSISVLNLLVFKCYLPSSNPLTL